MTITRNPAIPEDSDVVIRCPDKKALTSPLQSHKIQMFGKEALVERNGIEWNEINFSSPLESHRIQISEKEALSRKNEVE